VYAGFIIAQCNHNLAVADMLTGKLHITIKNKTLDPTLPATLLTAHTLAQPRDNKVSLGHNDGTCIALIAQHLGCY
jgi:hypothetical protein